MESRNMVLMNLFAEQQCRCTERTNMHKGDGEEGEGEMNGERLCNNLEGWERVKEGSRGRGQ